MYKRQLVHGPAGLSEFRTALPLDECFDRLDEHRDADEFVYECRRAKDGGFLLHLTLHQPTPQPLDTLYTLSLIHILDGSDEAKAKRTGLWQYLKDHVSTGVYRAVRYNLGGLTDLKFPGGDKLTLGVYRQLRKVFKFN